MHIPSNDSMSNLGFENKQQQDKFLHSIVKYSSPHIIEQSLSRSKSTKESAKKGSKVSPTLSSGSKDDNDTERGIDLKNKNKPGQKNHQGGKEKEKES
jgi:hypothetical protein